MTSLTFFVLSALVAQATSIPCVPPAISDASVQLWAPNIADVRGGPGEANGVGLVVGWRDGEAWLAVPAHVLYRGDKPPDDLEPLKKSLEIRFGANDSRRTLCPSRPGLSNPAFPSLTADVAFVCVQWNLNPFFWSTLTARSLSVNTEVELRGLESNFKRAGRVSRIEKDSADQFVIASFNGEPGMSGAPVVSPAGIVGLYLGSVVSGSRAVSTATVRRLAATAQVPWALVDQEFYDCRRSVRVCLNGDATLLPKTLTAATSSTGGGLAIPTNDCRDLPEGRYLLNDATKQFVCEPMVAMVRSDDAAALNVHVTCEPDLSGTWTSQDGLRMDCVAVGIPAMRQARCTGLQGMGLGMFTATVSRDGARLVLNGSFVDLAGSARVVTGEVTWRPGSLTGRLQVPGLGPVQIDLRKRDQ